MLSEGIFSKHARIYVNWFGVQYAFSMSNIAVDRLQNNKSNCEFVSGCTIKYRGTFSRFFSKYYEQTVKQVGCKSARSEASFTAFVFQLMLK